MSRDKKKHDEENNEFYDLERLKRGQAFAERTQSVPEDSGSRQKGLFASGVIVGMTAALLIVCGVYLGTRVQNMIQVQHSAGARTVSFQEESAISPEMVGKLQTLENTIDQYFYLRDVTNEELQDGIYRGMLEALNDPYSEYYTTEELDQLLNHTQGIFYGVGAYVSLDDVTSLPKISGVIEGAPAQEIGLRANDLIYEVDGVSTYGMSLTEAVALIKGEEGTQVRLTIAREGESDYLDFTVTRRRVETLTVQYEMLENDMAYIQIIEFDDVTVDQFADALATMKGSGMKGLILDLRGNPGGNVDSVVEIARMLLPEGRIVYTKDKYGREKEYNCDGKRMLQVPLTVLVDMNSASAAEILAGAIQDYSLGTLVGTTTFGKGIVQQIIPFDDGSAIKVTISSYFTPNGRDIHGVGITPDVECVFDGDAYYNQEIPYDNQLEKAKEVLMELMRN